MEFTKRVMKKQKIVGYFIVGLFLFLCLLNDIHDWYRKKRQQKKDWEISIEWNGEIYKFTKKWKNDKEMDINIRKKWIFIIKRK